MGEAKAPDCATVPPASLSALPPSLPPAPSEAAGSRSLPRRARTRDTYPRASAPHSLDPTIPFSNNRRPRPLPPKFSTPFRSLLRVTRVHGDLGQHDIDGEHGYAGSGPERGGERVRDGVHDLVRVRGPGEDHRPRLRLGPGRVHAQRLEPV